MFDVVLGVEVASGSDTPVSSKLREAEAGLWPGAPG